MKTTILFLIIITSGLYAKTSEIIKDSVILSEVTEERDSLGMPDVNDMFIILTPDTASYGKEGIFRQEKNRENGKVTITYDLISRSRAIRAILEYEGPDTDTCAPRKFILPKAFLDKIVPVDMDKKFPQFKNEKELWELFNWPYRTAEEVTNEYLRKRLANLKELILKEEQEFPGIQSAWLIDRRYMTEDSVILLKVSVCLNIEEFSPQ